MNVNLPLQLLLLTISQCVFDSSQWSIHRLQKFSADPQLSLHKTHMALPQIAICGSSTSAYLPVGICFVQYLLDCIPLLQKSHIRLTNAPEPILSIIIFFLPVQNAYSVHFH